MTWLRDEPEKEEKEKGKKGQCSSWLCIFPLQFRQTTAKWPNGNQVIDGEKKRKARQMVLSLLLLLLRSVLGSSSSFVCRAEGQKDSLCSRSRHFVSHQTQVVDFSRAFGRKRMKYQKDQKKSNFCLRSLSSFFPLSHTEMKFKLADGTPPAGGSHLGRRHQKVEGGLDVEQPRASKKAQEISFSLT